MSSPPVFSRGTKPKLSQSVRLSVNLQPIFVLESMRIDAGAVICVTARLSGQGQTQTSAKNAKKQAGIPARYLDLNFGTPLLSSTHARVRRHGPHDTSPQAEILGGTSLHQKQSLTSSQKVDLQLEEQLTADFRHVAASSRPTSDHRCTDAPPRQLATEN